VPAVPTSVSRWLIGALRLMLYAWPWLDLPPDNPRRTAFGAAFFTWVTTIFVAGAADRLFLITNVPYVRQVWIFRAGAFVFAVIAYLVVHRLVRRPRS
jgi:hypothetical protein